MAARSDALIGHLERTASIIPASGDMTVCLWVRAYGVTPAPGSYRTFYAQIDAPGTYAQYAGLYSELGTNDAGFSGDNGGGVQQTAFTATTLNQWYHLAWVQSGTSQSCYVNGSLAGSCTLDRAAVTVGVEYLLNDTFSTGDVDVAYCRQWTAALTADQIQAEMQSTTAVLNTGDYMDCPFETDALDISGFGHDWTTVGSITYVAQPTFPSNTTPATATEITGLPQSVTQDVAPSDVAFTVWYRYTAVSGNNVLGVWGFGDLVTYKPVTWIYDGPDSDTLTLYGSNNSKPNVPMILPVTVGQTYWFKFVPNSGNPTPASLAVSLLNHNDVTVPIGSIAINNDSGTLPLALLDSTVDQTILSYVQNIASGDFGDILDDGTLLLADEDNGGMKLYDATYTLLASVTTDATRVSCNRTDTFYISTQGVGLTHAVATTVSAAGVLGGTSWTLGDVGVAGIAPSPDETILYYTSTAHSSIQRWDLVNDIALADLTALPNRPGKDLLCLSDGSVIVPIPSSSQIRNYSAAGALLHTYTATGLSTSDRICRGLTDTSFWWWHGASSSVLPPVFHNIEVSTGTVLLTITKTYYEFGIYGGTATATPTARFGHSNSCPLWITRTLLVPPTPVGDPVEYLIRRERIFPVISKEQHRLFFSKLQLYFEAGVGLSSGQGSDPIVELDWSDDGGHTWSNLHLIQTGKQGQFTRRAMKWNMGSARERLYRVAVTDPVQWTLIDAFLELTEGLS